MRAFLLVIGIIGCGDGGVPAGSSKNFLGSWSNTTGTVNSTCGGGSQKMLNAGDLKITIADASSGITITFADPAGCQAAASVSGSTATVSADKACAISTGGSLTVKKGGSFTTPDGVTLSATFDIGLDDGKGTVCTQSNSVAFAH